MEKQDILKSFTMKVIDYVFYSKKSTMKNCESVDSHFQTRIPEFSHVHKEIEYIWEDKTKPLKEFSVEVFHQVDNCSPLLIERWNFKLSTSQNPHPPKNYFIFSSIFRSLIAICSLLPSTSIFPKSLFIRDSHLNTKWPSSLMSSDILQYPTIPYQLNSNTDSLIIFIQYYTKSVKPQISPQALGERPRLLSEGSIDLPSHSQVRTLSYAENKVRIIGNESIYEENEIGIKLISSELFEGSELENEEFGRSSFDMEIDISENQDTPEEAKISLYMLSCDKVRDLPLFRGIEDFEIKSIIDHWKNN